MGHSQRRQQGTQLGSHTGPERRRACYRLRPEGRLRRSQRVHSRPDRQRAPQERRRRRERLVIRGRPPARTAARFVISGRFLGGARGQCPATQQSLPAFVLVVRATITVLKTASGATPTWVRIPRPPPRTA